MLDKTAAFPVKRIAALILIGGIVMSLFSGCFAAKYRVDYGGRKSAFKGARDAYRAGASVTLDFGLIATDTDYYFYLDGEPLNPDYEEGRGYVIRFTMPEHDVTLTVDARNSMIYEPAPDDSTAALTFDSFDGGGPEFTVAIEDPSIVTYDAVKKYDKAGHSEMAGAGYTVTFKFFALAPGETTVTVSARSPIADNFDRVYLVQVDEDLTVRLTEQTPEETADGEID